MKGEFIIRWEVDERGCLDYRIEWPLGELRPADCPHETIYVRGESHMRHFKDFPRKDTWLYFTHELHNTILSLFHSAQYHGVIPQRTKGDT